MMRSYYLQILFFLFSFGNEISEIWVMKDYKVDKASLSASFCREVYQVVREIPVGKVSTYGGIAALLGMPQCSHIITSVTGKVLPFRLRKGLSSQSSCQRQG